MIILSDEHYQEILTHSFNALPLEACGLLGGFIEADVKIVKKVYGLTNVDQSPEHFTMDPREQFNVVKDARKNGLVVLGNFHSHPATPARPSAEDVRLAFDPEASYLILSLLNQDTPVLKSYRIREAEVVEEVMTIHSQTESSLERGITE
ncbi:M67 family metallopeptidase [Paradesulfitobacterium aromaticivorans]